MGGNQNTGESIQCTSLYVVRFDKRHVVRDFVFRKEVLLKSTSPSMSLIESGI